MSIQMTQFHMISAILISVLKSASVHPCIRTEMCGKTYRKNNYTKRVDSIYDDLSNKQQRVADCADGFPAVLEGSYQFFRPHHPRLRSIYIELERKQGTPGGNLPPSPSRASPSQL
jgi:hypothetical protein